MRTLCTWFQRPVKFFLIGLLLTSLLPMSLTFAAVPKLVRYQGKAVDSKKVPLEGPYTLTFRLYDAEMTGNIVWQETQPNIPMSGGHFSVLLGSVSALNVNWSQPFWLSIQVGTDLELAPRQQITSVPLAIVAEQLAVPITTSTVTDDSNRLVPAGAIILWNGSSCPQGYTRLSTLDGKFLASGSTFNANAGGQDSVTIGTSSGGSHAHSVSGTTSSASGSSCGWNAGKGCGSDPTDAAQLQHTHSASFNTNSAGDHSHSVNFDNRPAFAVILMCQKQ